MFIFIIFTKAYGNTFHRFWQEFQLNLSKTATFGTEEWWPAVVERFKQESMHGEMDVSGGSTVLVFS